MRRVSGWFSLMLCVAAACHDDDPEVGVCVADCGPVDSGMRPDAAVDSGMRPDAAMGGTDGGGDAGPMANVTACLEAAKGKTTRTEALRFAAKDGTQLAVVRYVDPDGFGTSGTTVWIAERLGYARGKDLACVTEAAKLKYQISHHNFDDTLAAQVADLMVTFSQDREDYDKPMYFSAEAKRGGKLVWGPLALSLVSCMNLTNHEDCRERY